MSLSAGMHALYFGADDAAVFGWLHAPVKAWPDLGVIVCSPFGREELSAHRSLRALAQGVCDAGLPAMRFDYPGCGDSWGDDDTPGLVERWIGSVHAAAEELKRLTGVSRVAFVGLRLGATLAAKAALTRDDTVAFAGIETVVAGRSFLRELKALQARRASSSDESADAFESGGFVLSGSSRDAVTALDLRQHTRPVAPQMLLIGRDDMPGNDRWPEQLRSQGAEVDLHRLPGYADMMLDPQNSVVPRAMVDAVVQWLQRIGSGSPAASEPGGDVCRQARFGEALERSVELDGGGVLLRGVLTLPADGRATPESVLLLNAGSTRRIGPSRLHVTLARRWAAQGRAVLRVDLSGLGDSECRTGAADNVVYSNTAVAETASAARQLLALAQAKRCHSVGLCAGAYHGLKAAVRGAPLHGVVAINPLVFFWHDGMSVDAPTADFEVADAVARYREGLFSAARWRKLISGQINLLDVLGTVWRGVVSKLRHTLRDVARSLHIPIEDDLAKELRSVHARGVGVQFVFSQRDPGRQLLLTQGGRRVAQMLDHGDIGMNVIAGADHTFSLRVPRAAALALLTDVFNKAAPGPDKATRSA